MSKRRNTYLDNAAVEWGHGGGIGFGAGSSTGRRSFIGQELDGSLHIDCFLLVYTSSNGLVSIFHYNKNIKFNFPACID